MVLHREGERVRRKHGQECESKDECTLLFHSEVFITRAKGVGNGKQWIDRLQIHINVSRDGSTAATNFRMPGSVAA